MCFTPGLQLYRQLNYTKCLVTLLPHVVPNPQKKALKKQKFNSNPRHEPAYIIDDSQWRSVWLPIQTTHEGSQQTSVNRKEWKWDGKAESVVSWSSFFLIGIHPMQGWTATMKHGITRKKAQKRLQGTENLFRKNLQLKDVC